MNDRDRRSSVTTPTIELIRLEGRWPDGMQDWLVRVPAGVQDGDLAIIRLGAGDDKDKP